METVGNHLRQQQATHGVGTGPIGLPNPQFTLVLCPIKNQGQPPIPRPNRFTGVAVFPQVGDGDSSAGIQIADRPKQFPGGIPIGAVLNKGRPLPCLTLGVAGGRLANTVGANLGKFSPGSTEGLGVEEVGRFGVQDHAPELPRCLEGDLAGGHLFEVLVGGEVWIADQIHPKIAPIVEPTIAVVPLEPGIDAVAADQGKAVAIADQNFCT